MSESTKEKVTCPYCHIQHEFKKWILIDKGSDPGIDEAVRSGELFIFECPSCKSTYDMNYPFAYHEPENRLFIMYANNSDDYENARLLLNGEKQSDSEAINRILSLPGYKKRLVFGREEFYEKLLLFDRGLDDGVMEIVKLIYGENLARKQKEDLFDAIRYFKDEETGEGVFFLMKEGQRVGKVNIDDKIYDWVISQYFDKIVEQISNTFIVNFYWALNIVRDQQQ